MKTMIGVNRPRNVFSAADIGDQLAAVRRDIERAVLIASGFASAGGDVPDLAALRKREHELIVRRHLASFNQT